MRFEVLRGERSFKCLLTDMGSRNGTWLNRARLQRCVLPFLQPRVRAVLPRFHYAVWHIFRQLTTYIFSCGINPLDSQILCSCNSHMSTDPALTGL